VKYVGIKSCPQKRKALKREGKIQVVAVADLVARDCSRHLYVLAGYGREYTDYQLSTGKTPVEAEKKVRSYNKLCMALATRGYQPEKYGYITVSENGARLDGSHRAAWLLCRGVKEVEVRVVPMDMTPELEKHLEEQRRAYC